MGTEPKPISHYAVRLDALRQFAAERGHSLVPQGYVTADGIRLGVWLKSRRQMRGESPELDDVLESFPGWSWGPGANRSLGGTVARLRSILEEMERTGRLCPPAGTPDSNWVSGLRRDYRAGRLPADMVTEMEALTGWSWEPARSLRRSPAGYEVELEAARAWATEVRPHVRRWLPARGEVQMSTGHDLGAWLRTRLRAGRKTTDPALLTILEDELGYRP